MNVLACITFHYVEARLEFLRSCIAGLAAACDRLQVRVFTNTTDEGERERICECFGAFPNLACDPKAVVSETDLPHPYQLAWCHKRTIRDEFLADARYTHFLYLEDDLLIGPDNLAYWCRYREALKPHGLIPSFFRVERDADGIWKSTDLKKRPRLFRTPKLKLSRDLWFLNLRNPYQGMYLFDRKLAEEHLRNPPVDVGMRHWGIRERAAQGQIFVDVPKGFASRNVVPYEVETNCVPACCWIHHLPNNYATHPESRFGKLPVEGPELIRRGFW